jgi:hypothetical protein
MSEWISVKDRLPPIYTEVKLLTQHGVKVKGCWMGHDTFSAPKKYPVLGQCHPTHWKPLYTPPITEEPARVGCWEE